MTKRFCDTEIWQKNWFLALPDKQKLLTKFIFDMCDCAGIYEINWYLLKVYFNSEITKKDFEAIKQIKFLDDDTIFIEDFILFQCGIYSLNDLNPNNNAHKGIIKRLEKYNIKSGANEGLTRGYEAPQEKEKEKDKEKDKEIEKEEEKEKEKEYVNKQLLKISSESDKPQKQTFNQAYRKAVIEKIFGNEIKGVQSG